jgi:hypothetical protein
VRSFEGLATTALPAEFSYDPEMAIQDALDRYFDGWNHGDGAAVV